MKNHEIHPIESAPFLEMNVPIITMIVVVVVDVVVGRDVVIIVIMLVTIILITKRRNIMNDRKMTRMVTTKLQKP